MFLLILSFVAGVLTVLAPCTLALLPVIVGGSVAGEPSKKRAIVVTISLAVSLIVFTLFLKASTLFITIPESVWLWISGGIILIFGLITLFPNGWDKMMSKVYIKSNKALAVGYKKNSIWGDIIIGAALGPVFSSCSPTYFLILATVLPQRPIVGFFYLVVYSIGLAGALLIISFIGQRIVTKLEWAADADGWFRKFLGILFIFIGIFIISGYEQKLEQYLIASNVLDITKVEQHLLQQHSPGTLSPSENNTASSTPVILDAQARIAEKEAMHYTRAPEIVDPAGFINTDGKPITLKEFQGKKVVLLDIWTYSCINCQRTLPYLKTWYDTYSSEGLEIIGIHTPEFSFEKVQKNVEDAVKALGIKYPVVLDNNYATWNALGNQYWPRKYLIDTDGFIVYDHIGEGNYDQTERAIQKALQERDQILNATTTVSTTISQPKDIVSMDGTKVQSPETYFGAARNVYLANGIQNKLGSQTLNIGPSIQPNALYLGGTWNFQQEYAESTAPTGTIAFTYYSKNVYLVGSSNAGVKIKVYRDGKMVTTSDSNPDGTITIKANKLYHLVEGTDYGAHALRIEVQGPGLDAYTFTFG